MNPEFIRPRQIFTPDPVLGWRLSAEQRINVKFRKDVVHTTNSSGWRTVAGSYTESEKALGFYGCSFTYGTSLDDSETFTSLLQDKYQDRPIINRGVGGQGTVQSLLKFRADAQNGLISSAIFANIGDHKYRNMPHPSRMRSFQSMDWYRIGVEHIPCAKLRRGKGVAIHYVPIWQPIVQQDALHLFTPDEIMLNQLTVGVFEEISQIAKRFRIPFHIVLLDDIDQDFNEAILASFDNASDISTPHDPENRFLPHDSHPNVEANQLYAKRLIPIIDSMIGRSEAQ